MKKKFSFTIDSTEFTVEDWIEFNTIIMLFITTQRKTLIKLLKDYNIGADADYEETKTWVKSIWRSGRRYRTKQQTAEGLRKLGRTIMSNLLYDWRHIRCRVNLNNVELKKDGKWRRNAFVFTWLTRWWWIEPRKMTIGDIKSVFGG